LKVRTVLIRIGVVKTTRIAAAVTAALLALSACGSDSDTASTDTAADATPDDSAGDAPTAPPAGVPSVIATTTIWADVTRQVACGGLAEVATIIPAGGDPHSFEPSLRDREALGDAALIVANGLGLEESLEDTIDAVESEGVSVIRVGDFVDPLPADGSAHDDDDGDSHDDGDDDHGDDHGPYDPHIWFDPTRVAATLPAIADGLAAAGVDRSALDACVADYAQRLDRLDTDLQDTVATIPADRRLLVTNHDSLSYFADRYGFEVLGSVIPSPSSLAATNPSDLEELATLIADTGVPAIFAETQHSSDDTSALADRVGDVEVVTLQTGTLGEPGSDTDNYIDWLTVTAGTIVDALG
jgi:zinc/manganese transport system substrate-binding protein